MMAPKSRGRTQPASDKILANPSSILTGMSSGQGTEGSPDPNNDRRKRKRTVPPSTSSTATSSSVVSRAKIKLKKSGKKLAKGVATIVGRGKAKPAQVEEADEDIASDKSEGGDAEKDTKMDRDTSDVVGPSGDDTDLDDSEDGNGGPTRRAHNYKRLLRKEGEWTEPRPCEAIWQDYTVELNSIIDTYASDHDFKKMMTEMDKYERKAQQVSGNNTVSMWFRNHQTQFEKLRGKKTVLHLMWCPVRGQKIDLSCKPSEAQSHTEFAALAIQRACGEPLLAINFFPECQRSYHQDQERSPDLPDGKAPHCHTNGSHFSNLHLICALLIRLLILIAHLEFRIHFIGILGFMDIWEGQGLLDDQVLQTIDCLKGLPRGFWPWHISQLWRTPTVLAGAALQEIARAICYATGQEDIDSVLSELQYGITSPSAKFTLQLPKGRDTWAGQIFRKIQRVKGEEYEVDTRVVQSNYRVMSIVDILEIIQDNSTWIPGQLPPSIRRYHANPDAFTKNGLLRHRHQILDIQKRGLPFRLLQIVLPDILMCEFEDCDMGPWARRDTYLTHLREIHLAPDPVEECEFEGCDMGPWARRDAYLTHLREIHLAPDPVEQCEFEGCDNGPWGRRRDYLVHLRDAHTGKKNIFCGLTYQGRRCIKIYTTLPHLRQHIQHIHPTSQDSTTYREGGDVPDTPGGNPLWTCIVCKEDWEFPDVCLHHIKEKHQGKPKCWAEGCGKSYQRENGLWRHIRQQQKKGQQDHMNMGEQQLDTFIWQSWGLGSCNIPNF
ncbi:hypothetical protein VTL71DRAFT_854 [Oculimacula yallundae]|uniref:C2H2-type domain-containing protein n=1 Tax=Oculimacula yallundae TaxID=86028 RepID=A0ABR4D173_9HELO